MEQQNNGVQETIHTIFKWGNETFGPNRTPFRVVIRAHRELSEVFTLFQKPNSGAKILNELADVAIVMCGFIPKVFDEIQTIELWQMLNTRMSVIGKRDPVGGVLQANNEMSKLMGLFYALESNVHKYKETKLVTANVLHCLTQSAVNYLGEDKSGHLCERSFWSEIDRKMIINRRRIWNVDFETGDAQHVDPDKT